jgi:hypothetical protein
VRSLACLAKSGMCAARRLITWRAHAGKLHSSPCPELSSYPFVLRGSPPRGNTRAARNLPRTTVVTRAGVLEPRGGTHTDWEPSTAGPITPKLSNRKFLDFVGMFIHRVDDSEVARPESKPFKTY